MDIPLLLIGTWILGPKFGIKTVVSTILIFSFTFLLEMFWGYNPVIHDGAIVGDKIEGLSMVQIPGVGENAGMWFVPDYFLNTVVAGIIYGLAIGLVFKSGATSGGSDIIAMILHKYLKVSLGTLVLIVDSCITLTSFVAFHDFRLPIYSILLIFIESKVIDIVVEGVKSYKTVFIVSNMYEEVRQMIINDLERGGTCMKGIGMYRGEERHFIYTSVSRREFTRLKEKIYEIDPNAFINVIDSNEIIGNGFKTIDKE